MNKRLAWAFLLFIITLSAALPSLAEERPRGRWREKPPSYKEDETVYATPTPPGPKIIGHISLDPKSPEETVDVPKIQDVLSESELSALRSLQPSTATLPLEPLLQYPDLPTGCESVALTIALKGLGFSLEKATIASEYLVYSDNNFAIGYVGDPFSEDGAGVFPPGLVRTANAYLEAQESSYKAYDASGVSFSDLLSFMADGKPVILWVTMTYEDPMYSMDIADFEGRDYVWYWNEHCVALKSYDRAAGIITLEDPLEGELTIDMETLEDLYDAIGYAVTVR